MNEDAVGVLKVFHRVGNLGVTKDLKTSDGEPLAIPLREKMDDICPLSCGNEFSELSFMMQSPKAWSRWQPLSPRQIRYQWARFAFPQGTVLDHLHSWASRFMKKRLPLSDGVFPGELNSVSQWEAPKSKGGGGWSHDSECSDSNELGRNRMYSPASSRSFQRKSKQHGRLALDVVSKDYEN